VRPQSVPARAVVALVVVVARVLQLRGQEPAGLRAVAALALAQRQLVRGPARQGRSRLTILTTCLLLAAAVVAAVLHPMAVRLLTRLPLAAARVAGWSA